jgi:hypothetical protein
MAKTFQHAGALSPHTDVSRNHSAAAGSEGRSAPCNNISLSSTNGHGRENRSHGVGITFGLVRLNSKDEASQHLIGYLRR